MIVDLFENKLPKEKFAATNKIWNQAGLNKAWQIGYVTNLIKQKKFTLKEEWEAHYFQSGKERLKIMSGLSLSDYDKLTGKTPSNDLKLNKINFEYGRTEEEVKQIGQELYYEICKDGNSCNVSMDECVYIAYFRIICETWNGIAIREQKTKETLEKAFKNEGYTILLIDTSGFFDYQYAVDFEVYWEGHIICGLQIKPHSYKSKKEYIEKAHKINIKKNSEYTKKYGRLVFYVYSNLSGEINNVDVISQITREIKSISTTTI